MMHLDPIMPMLTATAFIVVALGILLRKFKLPYVVLYLFVGILMGPYGLGLITESADLTRLGSIGVLLLLFFIGMEISLDKIISNWKIAIIGTLLQILISVIVIGIFGFWLNWPLSRIVLIGFVISLSSTAVVIKMLQDWKETETDVGRDAISILIVQDIAIVPMLIIIGLYGNKVVDPVQTSLQVGGGIIFILFLVWLFKAKSFSLPFGQLLRKDHELQVFSAFMICFGLATLTGLLHLSSALGAFLAGIIVSSAKETSWVHNRLEPFYVVFVAAFFVSVGMLIDLHFIRENIQIVVFLTLAALVINNLIITLIMRSLKVSWVKSIYGGALLAQIGEFSFVLAAVAIQDGLISAYGYNITIAVISMSLIISPFWIMAVKKLTC